MAKSKFSISSNLGNQSKTPEQIKRELYHFEVVPLRDIVPSENNFYSMDADSIRSLADDINENGILHPPIVKPRSQEGEYELIDGERRYRAITLLYDEGREEHAIVLCQVKSTKSELDAELLTISANMYTRNMTDADRLREAERIRAICEQLRELGEINSGRTRDYAARILKVSPAQAGIYNKINDNLTPELKGLAYEGGMSIGEANAVASMPKEKQSKIAEQAKVVGIDAIRSAVKEEKANKAVSGKQGAVCDLQLLINEIDSGDEPDYSRVRKVCAAAIKAIEKTI